MQIKGNCFIPPTNHLWLPATGLWGEIQPWRKPESRSLCAKCSVQDGFGAAERCWIPWLGCSAGRKCWDGAGCRDGHSGLAAARRVQEKGTRTGSCIPVMAKGEGSQGRAGSCSCTGWAAWVGASPQTENSSKANKRNTSFEGHKEFMASGQIQQIFLARRGRALNHHF